MKLYNGSSQNLEVLKPQKGMNDFENMTNVFLVKTFLHASLYAIGKTTFGVSRNRLVILGNLRLKAGYVYKVEVRNPIKFVNNVFVYLKDVMTLLKV